MDSERQKIVDVRRIVKRFPGVLALSDVSFDLFSGELHCIVGENGAGKSTLIKILSGALIPDEGELIIADQRYDFLTPHSAQSLGINTIYQENILASDLTVAENMFLGREKCSRFGFFSSKESLRCAREIMASYDIAIQVDRLVAELQPAERQLLKIIKAIETKPKILIMDEPTTALDIERIEKLLQIIENSKKSGMGIVYISHHLEEIVRIADRVTVLKDGRVVACHNSGQEQITMELLANEMVGRPIEKFYSIGKRPLGKTILKVSKLQVEGSATPVDLDLREGEILGIAGMVGSGRSEIIRTIFGADRKLAGEVVIRGRKIPSHKPKASIRSGIGLMTEERKTSGLFMNRSVRENISIVGLNQFAKPFLSSRQEKRLIGSFIRRLDIKTPSIDQEAAYLSGGNQQKVVLAKWLFRDVDVLLFDEPTVGIDVNTKTEIYRLMFEFVSKRKAIIMVSSEMPELISLCDRVVVIKRGGISTILAGTQITEQNILLNSVGGRK
ncbi:MAG: sugar ABC transporter ATP-binding protein [Spirochaetaceae bacterium]|nr:MAG: sugar ABC transporter ATP-binding protein [Spirochaetaceae bacterium]